LLRFRDSQAHLPLRHPARVFRMCSRNAEACVLARRLRESACWRYLLLRKLRKLRKLLERRREGGTGVPLDNLMETTMQWTTPSYTDMRFGFEITMYIATR
jgi:coenzyme PQQ precursor peptide PqqA